MKQKIIVLLMLCLVTLQSSYIIDAESMMLVMLGMSKKKDLKTDLI